ncbi:Y-family DNA polymerase [Gilvimarinus algae]|uniref:DNA polymerase Y family protein n=1 Tax=Gilvimarinus algae TaxID=3058037 RepID=A0ABT8TGK2_9GAMM|nr:DNA polymerase Y family protein [Gilvimarinus sp. SDUM040014]MDO3382258.1 DNA polymerase Y family protein [Gilvimarinus sp. SDUM040014]
MLWLYLHFPALQLNSLAPTEQPRALVCERSHTLVQLNGPARAAGLTPAMGLAMASSLCRQLEVIPYNAELNTRRLHEMARQLYAASAEIMLFEPDGLLFKAESMLRYYGGFTRYWSTLERLLNAEQVEVIPATGLRPANARLMARAGQACLDTAPEPLEQQWQWIALQHSELPAKTLSQLHQLGLFRFAELLQLPMSELANRLDRDSISYLRTLTGQKASPVHYFAPPAYFEHYRELPWELSTSLLLREYVQRSLTSLEQFLKARAQVTDAFSLTLHQHQLAPKVVRIEAGRGECRARVWQRLLDVKFESVHLDTPASGFTLRADPGYCDSPEHRDLFDQASGPCNRAELIALLRAKLGAEALGYVPLADDHRPECVAFPQPGTGTVTADTALALRPSLLLKTPRLYRDPLSIVTGPERITTGWWDQNSVIRDYYIARNRQGAWLWVFLAQGDKLSSPAWYLHGYFS